jgi:twitching motility protein PilT
MAAQNLAKLLTGIVSVHGSDVHLRAGHPPFVRIDGVLSRLAVPPLSAQFIEDVIRLTSNPAAFQKPGESWEYSFDQAGVARFRGHVFREAAGWALSLRVVPMQVPSFQELRLPPVVKSLATTGPGLVLVTGPTGSGKSTTSAAMMKHLATAETLHIVTIEDPIEYRIVDVPSCISQREIGRDTASYSDALHAAMREDPDILFLGEIRDAASLEVAMQAAETGHAVFSTFHTGSALKTIQRLLSFFSPEDQAMARARLADVLRGTISQRLVPRRGARTRVLCAEVMMNNYATKEAIRDPTRTPSLPAIIERSTDQQMQSFDQSLGQLVREQVVAAEVAARFASSPSDFRRSMGVVA